MDIAYDFKLVDFKVTDVQATCPIQLLHKQRKK